MACPQTCVAWSTTTGMLEISFRPSARSLEVGATQVLVLGAVLWVAALMETTALAARTQAIQAASQRIARPMDGLAVSSTLNAAVSRARPLWIGMSARTTST